ncbi:hypothetical protein Athai_58000 [Actinocatenispora thailandica]|uniref:DUF4386 domain-containing protein n=1 Tax=Actinocatenispora thailandica TaxID=227318 RepID=A0A7R7DVU5_9ACTN|nr:hypothetical protein [Actinocatenispora thailandica]BCJ38297.1 hypothetical protein Athai_58000 [Actinocatenispora thailandica]
MTSPALPATRTWYRTLGTAPALAGIGFALSWVIGLSVSSVSTSPHATGAEVIADLAGHTAAQTTQYLLTEGLPAIGIAIVAVAVARRARSTAGRALAGTGLVAALLSLVMCALGLHLTLWDAPHGDAATAGTLFDTISRVDGVKMALLGAMAAIGIALAGRGLPRWVAWLGAAVAGSMAICAVGYVFLLPLPAQAAIVALPLLIVWITAAGISSGRR